MWRTGRGPILAHQDGVTFGVHLNGTCILSALSFGLTFQGSSPFILHIFAAVAIGNRLSFQLYDTSDIRRVTKILPVFPVLLYSCSGRLLKSLIIKMPVLDD